MYTHYMVATYPSDRVAGCEWRRLPRQRDRWPACCTHLNLSLSCRFEWLDVGRQPLRCTFMNRAREMVGNLWAARLWIVHVRWSATFELHVYESCTWDGRQPLSCTFMNRDVRGSATFASHVYESCTWDGRRPLSCTFMHHAKKRMKSVHGTKYLFKSLSLFLRRVECIHQKA